jgi:hypothetical protein
MKKLTTAKICDLMASLLVMVVNSGWGAKAPISDKEREKQASHIVVGRVVAVSSKIQKSTIETAKGIHRDKVYTMTVVVETKIKGKKVKAGERITVVAWVAHKRFPPLAGWQGHESIPKTGEVARFFLTRNVGFFEPLMPNGIEIKRGNQKKPALPGKSRETKPAKKNQKGGSQ